MKRPAGILFLTVALTLVSTDAWPQRVHPTRHYYIAAEPLLWNYAPQGRDLLTGRLIPAPWTENPSYRKLHYVQYTDEKFSTAVPQPLWLGILGPIIRGVVGERLLVTFVNRTDRALSIHPHGVRYDKDSEGTFDLDPGSGGLIAPNGSFTYTWVVDEEAGPAPGEPSSKVWLYHSHVMSDEEVNLGLMGVIIITARGHARPDGSPADVDREFVTLYMIFDENWKLKKALEDEDEDDVDLDVKRAMTSFRKLTLNAQHEFLDAGEKHSINGFIFGNIPLLEMDEGDRVRWYVLALGSEDGVHTAHWHGKTVIEDGRRRTDDVELLPGSMKVADMKADNPGKWLFHCHVADHMMGGMFGYYVIHPRKQKAAGERTESHP